jgi:hypothetical protein
LLLPLCLGLAVDGFGQMTGYLFGPGDSVERVAGYEFHRFRHVSEADRRAAEETLEYSFDRSAQVAELPQR